MNKQLLMATFDHPDDAIAASALVRRRGCTIIDVYAPYALHGLDQSMGIRRSRLPWVCFVCGMVGAIGMLWFQYWALAVDWPIDVGGKPWISLPSDVPVAFEAMVLLAGFGTVLAFLAISRLYPGRKATAPSPDVTNNLFVLVVDPNDASLDLEKFRNMLQDLNVVRIERRAMSDQPTDGEAL